MVVERRKNGETVPMEEIDVGFRGHEHHSMDESTSKSELERENAPKTAGKNAIKGLLDPNTYATKKTIAQGLLDVALLTANASQLKYLLQVGTRHEFYYLMLSLISISIILQLAAGLLFFFSGMKNINERSQQAAADRLNNIATITVFAIVVVNVFISVFGMTTDSPPVWPPTPDLDTRNNETMFNMTVKNM